MKPLGLLLLMVAPRVLRSSQGSSARVCLSSGERGLFRLRCAQQVSGSATPSAVGERVPLAPTTGVRPARTMWRMHDYVIVGAAPPSHHSLVLSERNSCLTS